MDSENPPFSYGHNQGEPDVPLPEAIMTLLQAEIEALQQVEMVSKQLRQALECQVAEGEILRTRIKRQRNVPNSMKKACREQYWWNGMLLEIKAHGDQCAGYRDLLESLQERFDEQLAAFEQLQEDVDNLYPQ